MLKAVSHEKKTTAKKPAVQKKTTATKATKKASISIRPPSPRPIRARTRTSRDVAHQQDMLARPVAKRTMYPKKCQSCKRHDDCPHWHSHRRAY
jgi:hypothetical protein